ncbi:endonuclease/exonuclease/phosphatase family protein [uncultured Jannaschia sp.]|uniref:endonuclease/exonuclease/phosphatase family protein n=1 Tax=uncultured Jannaschia sp. TaxID=293347 RepID=UPI00260EBDD9|nr:endonuclease/exonuclease/phosphatase family protein [uncultured Jannaschia sp.]
MTGADAGAFSASGAVARLGPPALTLAAAIVGAALLARLHPALDAIGIGLPVGLLGAAFAAFAFLRRRAWVPAALAGLVLSAGLVAIRPILGDTAPVGDPGFRLLQHNLLTSNSAADLSDRLIGVDIATLQEAHAAHDAIEALPPEWGRFTCGKGRSRTGTAIVSRFPIGSTNCMPDGAWAIVRTPDGPVTVVSLHLPWPWPFGQTEQIEVIGSILATLPGPFVVAGDFNQTSWSATVARIAEMTGTRPIPGWRLTYSGAGGFMQLPIDHVLVPPGWRAEATVGGRHGSDHSEVMAQIGPV